MRKANPLNTLGEDVRALQNLRGSRGWRLVCGHVQANIAMEAEKIITLPATPENLHKIARAQGFIAALRVIAGYTDVRANPGEGERPSLIDKLIEEGEAHLAALREAAAGGNHETGDEPPDGSEPGGYLRV